MDRILSSCYPKIDAAAIKDATGKVHTLPRPNRHHNIIGKMRDAGIECDPEEIQGFITVGGTFLTRKAAAIMAIGSGQIEKLRWPPNLYTEDLW